LLVRMKGLEPSRHEGTCS